MIKGTCGCEISSAKNQIGKTVNICSECKGKCCNSHYYFNVDGNNIAITKSLFKMGICSKCLEKKDKALRICHLCDGQGWVIEVEASCCSNYKDYECCGIPEPVQVQVECKCDKGFVPNN